MSDIDRQKILDEAIEREQRERRDGTIDLIDHVISELPDYGVVVYLLYAYTMPPWETSTGVKFNERSGIRYATHTPGGGGSSGEVYPK